MVLKIQKYNKIKSTYLHHNFHITPPPNKKHIPLHLKMMRISFYSCFLKQSVHYKNCLEYTEERRCKGLSIGWMHVFMCQFEQLLLFHSVYNHSCYASHISGNNQVKFSLNSLHWNCIKLPLVYR